MAETPHPQLAALLQRIAAANYPDQTTVPLEEARRITVDRAQRFYGAPTPVDRVEPLTVDGAAGPLRARLYAPKASWPAAVVVYFHGGGWVLRRHRQPRQGGCARSPRRGAASRSRWTIDGRPKRSFRRRRRIVSQRCARSPPTRRGWAGTRPASPSPETAPAATLPRVCALMAREAGAPALAFQLLIYPVVDCDLDGGTYATLGDAPVLNRDRMVYFWDSYVPDPVRRADWRCSPLRAATHAGLPPGAGHRRRHRPPLWRRRRLCAQASRGGGGRRTFTLPAHDSRLLPGPRGFSTTPAPRSTPRAPRCAAPSATA